jgi:hypothetical protein
MGLPWPQVDQLKSGTTVFETIVNTSSSIDDPEVPYLCACVEALCSNIAKLSAAEVEALRVKSMEKLRLAQKRGQFNSPQKIEDAAKDKDLMPLHGRGDFKAWWREMTGKDFVAPAKKRG